MTNERMGEIVSSLRLAERAITQLLQELQEVHLAQREDHDALIRLQEQQQACQAATTRMIDAVERIVRGEGGGLQHAVQELRHGLLKLQEQVDGLREVEKESRSSQAIQTGHTMQAVSTVIAALIGASAGIASLLLQLRGGAGH